METIREPVHLSGQEGVMLIGAAIAGFFIVALLLEAISSPPKVEDRQDKHGRDR